MEREITRQVLCTDLRLEIPAETQEPESRLADIKKIGRAGTRQDSVVVRTRSVLRIGGPRGSRGGTTSRLRKWMCSWEKRKEEAPI